MSNVIKVTGAKEIIANLQRIEKASANKIARKVLRKASKQIQTRAKSEYPVKTGAARKAIKVRAGKRKKGRIQINVQVGDRWFVGDQFYAGFLEYGTKYMEAREPLQKAFNSEAPRLQEELPKMFWDEIRTVIK